MMKSDSNDTLARLFHEAIQQLGWSTDSASLVNRVKRLSLGIPAEDEFAFLLSWLGKCSIVHRLDQSQYPPISRESFQVPDLFACFETKTGLKSVLIEVKVSSKDKLSWKADYLSRLKKYSSLMGLPLLIAWKFHNMWILVDLNNFKLARSNYHLTLNDAMRNNLMSFLAGDFGYVMKPKVGLHFHFKKIELLSRVEEESGVLHEAWVLRVDKVMFTDASDKEISNLPTGMWPLFLAADPNSIEDVDDDYIYQHLIITEDSGVRFAHTALPVLIQFMQMIKNKDSIIHWRKHLDAHKFPVEFQLFKKAADESLKKGFIQYVLHQRPVNIPDFLIDIK